MTLHLLLYREDLVNALNKLYERRGQIDHIIIETTGLANPGPIVSSFYMDRYAIVFVQSPTHSAACGL
jgi:G3E family GTPase